jgi:hypothetical protein
MFLNSKFHHYHDEILNAALVDARGRGRKLALSITVNIFSFCLVGLSLGILYFSQFDLNKETAPETISNKLI